MMAEEFLAEGLPMEGQNRGNADRITREYFDSLLLEMRHLDGQKPDTTLQLFGEKFDTPIMTAALSHLDNVHDKGMVEMARGAAMANAVTWAGMGERRELEEMIGTGAKTIKIIKPYADNQEIFNRIAHAQEQGAFAVGIDVDHAFAGNGEYDHVLGYDMRPKSMEEIKEFIRSASLPFMIKGVLSERDAYKSLQAGAAGIVVSHHHGIMDYAVPPLMILPKIARVIGGQIPIFVDCGIASGMDAYKALALGATAVCVGRTLLKPLGEAGARGVCERLRQMTEELKGVMAKTGCADLQQMDASVIHKRDGF